MSNFSLPKSGTVFAPVAKFQQIINYDINRTPYVTKIDLGLKKVGLSDDVLKDMMSGTLKRIDMQVLIYIIYKLQKDSDVITLNPTIMERHVKKKHSTISASINRLCSSGYIMRVTGRGAGRCNYQVNVLNLFCGNRIEFLEKIDPKLIQRVK